MGLKDVFITTIAPALQKELGLKNKHEVPHIKKAVVNVGVGRINKEEEAIKAVEESLKLITGQKPVRTMAKKSISAFKIRKGVPIGLKVTIRGKRLYDFLQRLISITLPRVRDFQGLKTESVDPSGNLTIGFKEQYYFPEIIIEKFDKPHGLEVSLHAHAGSRDHAIAMYKKLGIPLKSSKEE